MEFNSIFLHIMPDCSILSRLANVYLNYLITYEGSRGTAISPKATGQL